MIRLFVDNSLTKVEINYRYELEHVYNALKFKIKNIEAIRRKTGNKYLSEYKSMFNKRSRVFLTGLLDMELPLKIVYSIDVFFYQVKFY